jgi:virulence-associated protein VapD
VASYIIKFDFDNDFVRSTDNIHYINLHNVMNMFDFRAIGDTTFMVDKPETDIVTCAWVVERHLISKDWFRTSIRDINVHKIDETTNLMRLLVYYDK